MRNTNPFIFCCGQKLINYVYYSENGRVDMDDVTKLHVFVTKKIHELKNFEVWWEEKSSTDNRDIFPNELLDEEWFEQFKFYIETIKKR